MDSNNNFNFNEDWDKPKKSNKNSLVKTITNGVIFGLCAGLVFTGTSYAGNKLTSKKDTSNTTVAQTTTVQADATSNTDPIVTTTYDVSAVAKEVMPAMVSIDITAVRTYSTGFGGFFGNSGTFQQEVQGSGSGIIFQQENDKLYVLTNYHVVEGAKSIKCTFIDNKAYSAKLTGYDEDHDLAVVEISLGSIEANTLDSIKVATIADSKNLTLGQPCVAIGNALGYGQSVTVGYVSATAREVQTTDKTQTLIQTDAAINPGNSGGALLNMQGEVIGVNSAKYSDTDVEGMGFAIPMSTVLEIVPDLINGAMNEAKAVYLGISGTSVTDAYVQSFGWPQGVYVSSIVEDSPADYAGLQAGDIIVEFDGTKITSMTELQTAIQSCKVDQEVSLLIARQQRNGEFEQVTITAKLAEKVED